MPPTDPALIRERADDESCYAYGYCEMVGGGGFGVKGAPLGSGTARDDEEAFLDFQANGSPFARPSGPKTLHTNAQLGGMLHTVAVSAERCRTEMSAHDVVDLHTLSLHALDRGLLIPTALPLAPFAAANASRMDDASGLDKIFDGDLESGVWLPTGRYLGIDLGGAYVPVMVRVGVCGGEEARAPQAQALLENARLEGSIESWNTGYRDLGPLLAVAPLRYVAQGVYLTTALPPDTPPVRWLRIAVPQVGPNATKENVGVDRSKESGVCLTEIEVHRGEMTRRLSELESGSSSFTVRVDWLYDSLFNASAYMLKCAAYDLFPLGAHPNRTETVLPERAGAVLTTGNLGDVTKDAGNMSSLSVLEDLQVQGSLSLGDATDAAAFASSLQVPCSCSAHVGAM